MENGNRIINSREENFPTGRQIFNSTQFNEFKSHLHQ